MITKGFIIIAIVIYVGVTAYAVSVGVTVGLKTFFDKYRSGKK